MAALELPEAELGLVRLCLVSAPDLAMRQGCSYPDSSWKFGATSAWPRNITNGLDMYLAFTHLALPLDLSSPLHPLSPQC